MRDWVTVIEMDFVIASPETAVVAQHVSASLDTFTISFMADEEMMYYSFFSGGREIDSYTSCPQRFEDDLLTKEEIEDQRHTPDELFPILPPGGSIDDVAALLNRGWWNAHYAGKLDDSGLEPEGSDGFENERERMTLLGTLMALHGSAGEYPYTAWPEDPRIDWSEFQVAAYRQT